MWKQFLAPILGIGVLALPSVACAQILDRRADTGRYRDNSAYSQVRRIAYDQGYRDGLQEGQRDARRGETFRFEDERDFRNADKGYHRSYGDRERYRQIFRTGYAAGYSDAYNRNARYDTRNNGRYGNGGYRNPGNYGGGYYSPGFDNGARDGYEKGVEDARKNRSFDVLRHSWYRSGDRHYESRYGAREQYKDIYRRGFQQGYERGYREGRYR